jgi:hypothetical protein
MADEIAQLVPGDVPGTIRASYDPDFVPQYDAQGNVFLIPIPDDEDGSPLASDVIASYDRELVHAGRKCQTLLTYRKAWRHFEAAFARLPTDRDLILDYLGNFDGPSGRYRLNNQDSIHYLYKHAVSLGWMVSDPMHGMKRPNIQEQMPNPMALEQVRMVLALDMSLRERAAAHLLAGHGWRQNELLEVLAGEVRAIAGARYVATASSGPNGPRSFPRPPNCCPAWLTAWPTTSRYSGANADGTRGTVTKVCGSWYGI